MQSWHIGSMDKQKNTPHRELPKGFNEDGKLGAWVVALTLHSAAGHGLQALRRHLARLPRRQIGEKGNCAGHRTPTMALPSRTGSPAPSSRRGN